NGFTRRRMTAPSLAALWLSMNLIVAALPKVPPFRRVTLTRETDPPYDRRSTTRAGRPAVGAFFPNWWSSLPPFATVVEHCISTKKEEKIYRATLPCHGGKRWQRRRSLVKALAQDLDAEVEVVSDPGGVNVSLKHAALTSG